MTRDPSLEKADIFRVHARRLFGALLNILCEEAMISQNKLGKKAAAYRRYLVSNGYIFSDSDTGDVQQSGVSRVIQAERPPSYSQVYIWLYLLREIFESGEYRSMCAKGNRSVYEFTQTMEADMWRLALCGTPDEVVEAYYRHKGIMKEN